MPLDPELDAQVTVLTHPSAHGGSFAVGPGPRSPAQTSSFVSWSVRNVELPPPSMGAAVSP